MNKRRVGVIMGGSSGEHEVSLRSGAAMADALEARGHEVVRVVLDGPSDGFAQTIRRARIDVAVLALHGRLGEDGCVQGLLEMAAIPYTGSGVLASALAMDKLKAKELFRLHNVPTPPYYTLNADQTDDLAELHGSFGFPVIVKPRSEGSSLGVSRANDLGALARAVDAALEHDDDVLIERFIQATEINVGILDGEVLGAIEIAPKKGIYDYEAKYTPGMTEYFMPARINPVRYDNVLNLAKRAAQALGCSGAVRVDLLVTAGDNEYVLEVNTLPGMTKTSLLPKIAKHAGYDFADLCEEILAGARLHAPGSRRRSAQRTAASAEVVALDEVRRIRSAV